jgi:hypothetical protein
LGNLSTPKSVQKLQMALHAKAKAEAGYRFYALYDKITARRKGRQQTNQTYCHRATARLYRLATAGSRNCSPQTGRSGRGLVRQLSGYELVCWSTLLATLSGATAGDPWEREFAGAVPRPAEADEDADGRDIRTHCRRREAVARCCRSASPGGHRRLEPALEVQPVAAIGGGHVGQALPERLSGHDAGGDDSRVAQETARCWRPQRRAGYRHHRYLPSRTGGSNHARL